MPEIRALARPIVAGLGLLLVVLAAMLLATTSSARAAVTISAVPFFMSS